MAHFQETPFTVSVYDLMHRPGEMREREYDIRVPERFGNAVIGVPEGDAVHVDLRLESLHDGVLVTATVDAEAVGECVRCLTDVRLPVQVDIQEVFAYPGTEGFEYEVQDDHVDLEPVIRDSVVLALPFQPVCQDDCPGLCPQCGVRLLDNPDHRHELPVDSRWAALAEFEGFTQTAEAQDSAVRPDAPGVAPEAGADREKR